MRDGYIETCIIDQNTVNIITLNGYQMIAKILVEENDHIVIMSGGKKKLVFKHAISTIEPANPKIKA